MSLEFFYNIILVTHFPMSKEFRMKGFRQFNSHAIGYKKIIFCMVSFL